MKAEGVNAMDRITVIGSLNMDMVINAPRIPALGETILGGGFSTIPGGKGANQATAIARLGGDLAMAGCVGDDAFGGQLIRSLKESSVDVSNVVKIPGCSTGVAVIAVCGGDNCIIVDPGANGHMDAARVTSLKSLIAGSAMIVLQLEIPLDAVAQAMWIAKKHDVKVLLNPAPAVPLDPEILRMTDFITPNESECGILTGRTIRTVDDAKEATMLLRDREANAVVVTLGENGALLRDKDGPYHVTARKVTAVDTTAAGDSFTGALAWAVVHGKSMRDSVRFASLAASVTVTRRGAQTSLPSYAEVIALCPADL